MAKAAKKKKETPLMQQYNAIKAKYPDAVLLFRVGDFYETFGEDAIKAARILGIVLTNRANGSSKIELAGSLKNFDRLLEGANTPSDYYVHDMKA